MNTLRFKPMIGKMFWAILIPTAVLLAVFTVIGAFSPIALFVVIPVDLLTLYFIISPLFGYVELREREVFIKFGLITKRSIPYSGIRGVEKVRRFYSDSMISLKNSAEHVNIKYATFDLVSVSVTDNDALIREIEERTRRVEEPAPSYENEASPLSI